MRKILLVILSVIMALSISCFFGCGCGSEGLVYALSEDGTYYTVTSIGTCTNRTVTIPNRHKFKPIKRIENGAFSRDYLPKKVVIGNNVESIGFGAFGRCDSLQSVTIPKSVKEIGVSAFSNCELLTKVEYKGTIDEWVGIQFGGNPLSNGAELYINGKLQTDVTINAENINDMALYNCDSLKNVTIGNSVKSIGNSTFSNCDSLQSVTIGEGVESIGDNAFSGCSNLQSISIPKTLTSFGKDAFLGCKALEKVDYNGSIDEWTKMDFHVENANVKEAYSNPLSNGADLFINGVKQTEVTINDNMNDRAFFGCGSLQSVIIGNNVDRISKSVFNNCDALQSITIGKSVKRIESFSCFDCNALEKVNYTGTIDEWVGIDFEDSTANPLYNLVGLYINDVLQTDVTLNAEKVNDFALYGCSSLENVNIGSGVKSIGDYVFFNCLNLRYNLKDGLQYLGGNNNKYLYLAKAKSSLTNAVIDSNCKLIGSNVFKNYQSLQSITIPKSVTWVGMSAFNNCPSLTKVNYTGTIDEWVNIDFNDYNANPLTNNVDLYLNGVLQTDVKINAEKINDHALSGCTSLESVTIGSSVKSIGKFAFLGCTSLESGIFENTTGWQTFASSTGTTGNSISSTDLSNTEQAAAYLRIHYYWKRS